MVGAAFEGPQFIMKKLAWSLFGLFMVALGPFNWLRNLATLPDDLRSIWIVVGAMLADPWITIPPVAGVAIIAFSNFPALRFWESPPDEEPVVAVPKDPIWYAVLYVSLAIQEKYDSQCWPRSRQAIRQAAIDEQIRLRGRKRLPGQGIASEAYTDINRRYWEDHEIDSMATSPLFVDSYHTKTDGTYKEGEDEYWSLLVDMQEIVRTWTVDPDATIAAGEAVESIAWASQQSDDLTAIKLRDLAHTGRLRTWGRRFPTTAIRSEFEPLEQIAAQVWGYAVIHPRTTKGPLPTNCLRYVHGHNEADGHLYEAVRFNRKEIVDLCLAEGT